MNEHLPGEEPETTANGNGSHGDTAGPQVDQSLLDMILEFVNAEDWGETRRVLNQHPMLLSEDAMAALEALIRSYLAQDNLRLAYHLAIHRDLLRLARELGYDRAFELVSSPPSEEMVRIIAKFIQAENWTASREVLDRYPELLSHEANAAFQALIQAALEAGDQGRLNSLVSHHELLRAAQELGVDEAFHRAEAAAEGDETADLMMLSVIGHNTIAVMLGEREKRGDWLKSVRQLHREARAEGDEALAGLLSAVMKLLNGKPAAEIEPEGLDAPHRAVWVQIVSALGSGGTLPES